jgi:hypothetical protein
MRYHPFKTMPINNMPMTACAMCGASGEQTCLNCLGEGHVSPGTLGSSRGRPRSSTGSSSTSHQHHHQAQQQQQQLSSG